MQKELGTQHFWAKDMWPGASPDLNVIENLWAILKEVVYKAPRPRTLDQLKKSVQEEWAKIPEEILQKLVDSFADRVEVCIAAEGGDTRY